MANQTMTRNLATFKSPFTDVTMNQNDADLLELFKEPDPIVSDSVRRWLESVLYLFRGLFNCLGVVTNSLNFCVFTKQGIFSSSNTVCLFALTVADFVSSLVGIPQSICDIFKYLPSFTRFYNCRLFTSYHFGSPTVTASRINCLITLYIAIEMCMCVMIPLKVKILFRPKTAAIAMAFIYVSVTLVCASLFIGIRLNWQFVDAFNVTVFVISETESGKIYHKYLSVILYTFIPPTSIIVVAIATGVMVFKLNEYKKWRQGSYGPKLETSQSESENGKGVDSNQSSTRTGHGKKDIETLKLVIMVTGLYLFCQTMGLFPGFASFLVPGFSFTGHNSNLFNIAFTYTALFDAINSSVNFFFYIRISSRYRDAFNNVGRLKRKH